MAGIAFKLRRYTEDRSYFGILKGYTYSAFLVAGPWLISAAALGVLAFLAKGEVKLFHAIIMYIFCFSLIYVGLFQFVVTRFLADKLYCGDLELQIPTFISTLLLTLVPQALAGGLFLYTLEVSFAFRFAAFNTYMVINCIFVILLFLGVVRAYKWAVWSFILGGGVGIVVGFVLAGISPQTGILTGYMAGQAVTLAVLIWLLVSEFPWKKKIDFSFLTYFRAYPALALLGICYYLSIWIDKFIYRASHMGTLIAPKFLYAAPSYELLAFIAQLAIVPAMAIFFLHVETSFYEHYRKYYEAIAQQQPLTVIESARSSMLNSLRKGFVMLLKFQGIVSLILILLAPQIFRTLMLSDALLEVLRVLILGTFFQTFLFLAIILMLYFEFYSTALVSCMIFLAGNGALTVLLLRYFPQTAGLGYALSAFVALVYAAWALNSLLKRLTEITFMRLPERPVITGKDFLNRGEGIALYHVKPR